jgi:hypothetical protein
MEIYSHKLSHYFNTKLAILRHSVIKDELLKVIYIYRHIFTYVFMTTNYIKYLKRALMPLAKYGCCNPKLGKEWLSPSRWHKFGITGMEN